MTETVTTLPRLLTVRQVAQLTGYTPGTIYNMISEGKMASVKNDPATAGGVRIREEDYIAWYKAQTVRNPIKTRRGKAA